MVRPLLLSSFYFVGSMHLVYQLSVDGVRALEWWVKAVRWPFDGRAAFHKGLILRGSFYLILKLMV